MPWCKLRKWIPVADRRRQRRWKLEHESFYGAVIRAIGAAFGGGEKKDAFVADPDAIAKLDAMGFGDAITYIDPGSR